MKLKFSLKQRKELYGYLFIAPFIIGFILFFLYPFAHSFYISFHRLSILSDGYELTFMGLENYYETLFVHPEYLQQVIGQIREMVTEVPLILIFSFFAANLLNQNFRGRTFARIIFFLPVIMGAGIILSMEGGDFALQAMTETQTTFLDEAILQNFLRQLRFPEGMMDYVIAAVEGIPGIIRASGIQILIFLAGLQSISPSLYEAADVEGATGWESFWLITLPMLSPLILTNVVYSIIDFLTGGFNNFLNSIALYSFRASFGRGTTMAWIYFAVIFTVLGITIKLLSKWVFYQE